MPYRHIEALLNEMKMLHVLTLIPRKWRNVDLKTTVDTKHRGPYVEDRPWSDRMHSRTILSMPTPSPRHALDPALVALGMAIRASRQARGLSQEELAHQSQVDRSYMSGIERGTQNPGVMVVVRIAAAIGISVAELATEAGL